MLGSGLIPRCHFFFICPKKAHGMIILISYVYFIMLLLFFLLIFHMKWEAWSTRTMTLLCYSALLFACVYLMASCLPSPREEHRLFILVCVWIWTNKKCTDIILFHIHTHDTQMHTHTTHLWDSPIPHSQETCVLRFYVNCWITAAKDTTAVIIHIKKYKHPRRVIVCWKNSKGKYYSILQICNASTHAYVSINRWVERTIQFWHHHHQKTICVRI